MTRLLLTLIFVALPTLVLAHPGPHSHPHEESPFHALLSLDHVLPLLGIVLAIALYRGVRARR